MCKRGILIFPFIYLKNDAHICVFGLSIFHSVNLRYAYIITIRYMRNYFRHVFI